VDDFLGKFAFEVGLMPLEATRSDIEALLRFRMDTQLKDQLLFDKDKIGPPMRVVGYEIYKDDGKTETVDLYQMIPRTEWGSPVFPNPGFINESTGLAPVMYSPASDGGNVGIIIYFQFMSQPNF
jgi:hypothetical protein